jgi:hypothetical protein
MLHILPSFLYLAFIIIVTFHCYLLLLKSVPVIVIFSILIALSYFSYSHRFISRCFLLLFNGVPFISIF